MHRRAQSEAVRQDILLLMEVGRSARTTTEQQHSGLRVGGRAAGSLEAVEHLALHAVLDLTPAQHELQHLPDGVLWILL